MARYKILLKHNWEETDWTTKRQKSLTKKDGLGEPDLIDLELATKRRSYPTNGFFREMDHMRATSIWLYRTLSSFAVILMVISILYACSDVRNKNLATIRTRNKQIEDSSIVSRKMRTNMTHEEYMSSLSYDAFISKVEEQIRQKKLVVSDEASRNDADDAKQPISEHEKSEGVADRWNNTRAPQRQAVTNDVQASSPKVHPRSSNLSSEPKTPLSTSPAVRSEGVMNLARRTDSQPSHLSNRQRLDLVSDNGIADMSTLPSLESAWPLAQPQVPLHFATQTGFSIPQLTGTWFGNPTKMVVSQSFNTQPLPQMRVTIPQQLQTSPQHWIPNPFMTQTSVLGSKFLMPGQQRITMTAAGQLPVMGTSGSLPQLSQVVPSLPQVLTLFPKLNP